MEKQEVKKKITREDQLKMRDNFLSDEGKLYLVKCVVCGYENYAPNVVTGQCTWCGWMEE